MRLCITSCIFIACVKRIGQVRLKCLTVYFKEFPRCLTILRATKNYSLILPVIGEHGAEAAGGAAVHGVVIRADLHIHAVICTVVLHLQQPGGKMV